MSSFRGGPTPPNIIAKHTHPFKYHRQIYTHIRSNKVAKHTYPLQYHYQTHTTIHIPSSNTHILSNIVTTHTSIPISSPNIHIHSNIVANTHTHTHTHTSTQILSVPFKVIRYRGATYLPRFHLDMVHKSRNINLDQYVCLDTLDFA